VWALVDRLENRLGAARVRQVAAVESHIPERAVADVPVRKLISNEKAAWPKQQQRPLTLLPSPESITAMAPVPDDAPLSFTWRRVLHKVARAEGPERIDPEWWRLAQSLPDRRRCRDYYCVEDTEGRRYWLFREGLYGLDPTPRWFMHGVFA
jgi:protein ImuB